MSDLSEILGSLANPTRLAIVDSLCRRGEQPVADLQKRTGVSGPALSRHLKLLRAAGVLQMRAQAQRRLYSVRPEALKAVGDWVAGASAPLRPASGLDRLDAMLKKARR